MEFDDEERDDEEMEVMPAAPPGYGSASAASRPRMGPTGEGAVSTAARKRGSTTTTTNKNNNPNTVRYRECQKNHAVNIGSHAVDGCCEFLASGEEGTMDALKCAACNCHRNFHRKEPAEGGGGGEMIVHHHHQGHGSGGRAGGGPHHLHQLSSAYYRGPPPPPSGYLITSPQQARAAALAAGGGGGARSSREEGDQELVSNPSSSGGSGMQRKRYRTKFTAEQKQKMLEFAEKVGWRMQKHDEASVEEFCEEMGVKRQVFKVWMHNNKHTLGKKLEP